MTCESTMQLGQNIANQINGLLTQHPNLKKIHKIFIAVQSDQVDQDDWRIIVIHPMNKEIFYFNPKGVVSCEIIEHDMTDEPQLFITDIKQQISDSIDSAIQLFDIHQETIAQAVNIAGLVPAVVEPVNAMVVEQGNDIQNHPRRDLRGRRRGATAEIPVIAPEVNQNQEINQPVQAIRPHQWKCDRYPFLYCPAVLTNDFDSGVACFLAMFMIAVDCPVVLHLNELSAFRRQIAYWLATTELPC